jgi:Flp pilus assembly secretin CpaC
MTRKLWGAAIALAFMALPASAQNEQPVPLSLEMTTGMVRMFRAPEPVRNVIVGADSVADVSVVSDLRIAITGKKEGVTSLIFLGEGNKLVGSLEVVVHSVERAGRNAVNVRTGHGKPLEYLCSPGEGCRASAGAPPAGPAPGPATTGASTGQ